MLYSQASLPPERWDGVRGQNVCWVGEELVWSEQDRWPWLRLREVAGDEGSRASAGQEFLFWEPQSAFCVAHPGQVFEKVGREHP